MGKQVQYKEPSDSKIRQRIYPITDVSKIGGGQK